MNRVMVYPGAIPLETDLLNAQKNDMIGLAKLSAAVLGTATQVNGLACTPNIPAALNVIVAPGEIYSLQNIDGTAYSSLAADTAHQIVKQGILLDQVILSTPAPATAGQSINYLIQATYSDVDGTPVVLPYYNASNPSTAFSGPAGAGTTNNTVRAGVCTVSVKTGVSATTGSQVTPAPDAGNVGLYVVTVANGQTTVTAPNIAQLATAPILGSGIVPAMQSGAYNYAVDTGAANALVVALKPGLTTLTAGMLVRVKVAVTSTAGATIAVNGLAAVPIVHGDSSALQPGDLTAGQVADLRYDGTKFQLVPETGRLIGVQIFPASGTYTPTPGTKSIVGEVQSAGGAGGGTPATSASQNASAGGGSSGSYGKGRFTAAQIGASQVITIGLGGVGVANAGGGNGGTSSLGSLLSAPGGIGGSLGLAAAANTGSIAFGASPPTSATGGNILNASGVQGGDGFTTSNGVLSGGGAGSPILGGGGSALRVGATTGGNAAAGKGAGGGGACGGASDIARSGGNGGDGLVIIWEFA